MNDSNITDNNFTVHQQYISLPQSNKNIDLSCTAKKSQKILCNRFDIL